MSASSWYVCDTVSVWDQHRPPYRLSRSKRLKRATQALFASHSLLHVRIVTRVRGSVYLSHQVVDS